MYKNTSTYALRLLKLSIKDSTEFCFFKCSNLLQICFQLYIVHLVITPSFFWDFNCFTYSIHSSKSFANCATFKVYSVQIFFSNDVFRISFLVFSRVQVINSASCIHTCIFAGNANFLVFLIFDVETQRNI